MKTILTLGMLVLSSCPPAPNPPAPQDGGSAVVDAGGADASLPASDAAPAPADAAPAPLTACGKACVNLAALGCSEGSAANCASTCDKAQSARLTDMHPDCLAAAKDKAAIRACGPAVKCP